MKLKVTKMAIEADIIGGFPISSPYCAGCGNKLNRENAWMVDGCPCNSELGVNNLNQTRWLFLMQLQQLQVVELETAKRILACIPGKIIIKAKEKAGFGSRIKTRRKR
jgi:hypothetical protein